MSDCMRLILNALPMTPSMSSAVKFDCMYASTPTPLMMRATVSARAPGTSRMWPSSKKPTVEMVMTVMYAQSPNVQRPRPSA